MTSFSYPYHRNADTGLTSAVRILDTNNQEAFENECFRDWLNRIDARITYEVRHQWATWAWRNRFDLGESESEAIHYFRAA